MKVIASHIDAIRELIKQTSDDSKYGDQLLYKLLVGARGKILGDLINRYGRVSEHNYQSICMQVEPDTYHDCNCVSEEGCWILKSLCQVPENLSLKFKDLMEVTTVDNSKQFGFTSPGQSRVNKFSNTRKDKTGYFISNHNIILLNSDMKLRVIKVRGIFEDPADLAFLPFVNLDGTCTDKFCFSKDNTDFPLDARLQDDVYDKVLADLGLSMRHLDKETNRAEDPTGPKRV